MKRAGEKIEEFDSSPDYLLREDRFDYPTTLKHNQTVNCDTNAYDESHFDGLNLQRRLDSREESKEKVGLLSKLKSLLNV